MKHGILSSVFPQNHTIMGPDLQPMGAAPRKGRLVSNLSCFGPANARRPSTWKKTVYTLRGVKGGIALFRSCCTIASDLRCSIRIRMGRILVCHMSLVAGRQPLDHENARTTNKFCRSPRQIADPHSLKCHWAHGLVARPSISVAANLVTEYNSFSSQQG